MLKALINVAAVDLTWCRKFFPDYPALLLPLGNKPYLEFLVDFCLLAGAKEVRLVLDEDAGAISEHFGDGEKFGCQLSYAYAGPDCRLKDLIAKNRSFCVDSALLLLSGMPTLSYDKNKLKPLSVPENEFSGEITKGGAYYWFGQKFLADFRETPAVIAAPKGKLKLSFGQLDSVSKYYECNLRLVKSTHKQYNLPGYGDQERFLVGRDVEIPHTAELFEPIIIGDCVRFERGTCAADSVIGNNVLIDRDTVVLESVILDNTYLGYNLELRNKICYHNYLIDPVRQTLMDIADDVWLSALRPVRHCRTTVKQKIVALLLLILYCVPFLLLRPFLKQKAVAQECYSGNKDKVLTLRLYGNKTSNFADRYWRKLCLDKYHLLFGVLSGKLRLVGNYILVKNPANAQFLKSFPAYGPGVFSYAESLGHEQEALQRNIDEMYYSHNVSFLGNIKILLQLSIRNLFKRT